MSALKPPMIGERDEWLCSLHKQLSVSEKNWWLATLLSLCGFLGLDRFYLGSPLLGFFKLCTLGGLGFWWLGDFLLLLLGMTKDCEGKIVKRPF